MYMPLGLSAPFRLLIRNLFVALIVGLPTLIVSAAIGMWLAPPAWMKGHGPEFSAGGFIEGFLFWYVLLALPTLVVAFLHQVALSALPHDWSPRRERIVIVGSALGSGVLLGVFVGAGGTQVDWVGIMSAVVPASLVYGLLVRPLRTAG
jgi:hypothetical protein